MKALIVGEEELPPGIWPDAPEGLSDAAALLDPELVWSRIEQFITRRWGLREVVWHAVGPGIFAPRLRPATLTHAERWEGDDWVEVSPARAPRGLILEPGEYRLQYDVGSADPVPLRVLEAYRRLAEYWVDTEALGGAVSMSDGDFSVTRSPYAVPRALIYSGAADLLRAYRGGML